MKTIRTLIGFVALAIIGFTNINATADYKKAMNTELAVESEASLSIEDWMTNENYWMLDESSLSLEEWMTNDNYWNSNAVIVSEETENSLKVESWMTDEKIWK
jgi:hypothetical protein